MKKMFAGCIAVVVLALALVVTFGVAALGQVAIKHCYPQHCYQVCDYGNRPHCWTVCDPQVCY